MPLVFPHDLYPDQQHDVAMILGANLLIIMEERWNKGCHSPLSAWADIASQPQNPFPWT